MSKENATNRVCYLTQFGSILSTLATGSFQILKISKERGSCFSAPSWVLTKGWSTVWTPHRRNDQSSFRSKRTKKKDLRTQFSFRSPKRVLKEAVLLLTRRRHTMDNGGSLVKSRLSVKIFTGSFTESFTWSSTLFKQSWLFSPFECLQSDADLCSNSE